MYSRIYFINILDFINFCYCLHLNIKISQHNYSTTVRHESILFIFSQSFITVHDQSERYTIAKHHATLIGLAPKPNAVSTASAYAPAVASVTVLTITSVAELGSVCGRCCSFILRSQQCPGLCQSTPSHAEYAELTAEYAVWT